MLLAVAIPCDTLDGVSGVDEATDGMDVGAGVSSGKGSVNGAAVASDRVDVSMVAKIDCIVAKLIGGLLVGGVTTTSVKRTDAGAVAVRLGAAPGIVDVGALPLDEAVRLDAAP